MWVPWQPANLSAGGSSSRRSKRKACLCHHQIKLGSWRKLRGGADAGLAAVMYQQRDVADENHKDFMRCRVRKERAAPASLLSTCALSKSWKMESVCSVERCRTSEAVRITTLASTVCMAALMTFNVYLTGNRSSHRSQTPKSPLLLCTNATSKHH